MKHIKHLIHNHIRLIAFKTTFWWTLNQFAHPSTFTRIFPFLWRPNHRKLLNSQKWGNSKEKQKKTFWYAIRKSLKQSQRGLRDFVVRKKLMQRKKRSPKNRCKSKAETYFPIFYGSFSRVLWRETSTMT